MTLRRSLTLFALAFVLCASSSTDRRDNPFAPTTASDSALDELAVGRFWHASRILRAEGAVDGVPADVLTLARAEAGWHNWPAVHELLDGTEWLSALEGGHGLYLLGRSMEDGQRWSEASVFYGSYAERVGADLPGAAPALARQARTAWLAGDAEVALEALSALRASTALRSWTAAELALRASEDGDAEAMRGLAEHAIEPPAIAALWRAWPDAHLNAADSVATAEAWEAVRGEVTGSRRTVATVELGRLRVASGDTTAGRALLVEGLDDAPASGRARAAEVLADLGGSSHTRTLELARILDRSGDGARALREYDRARRQAVANGNVFPEASRLERARLMATVRSRQGEALEEFRAIRDSTENERVGARNLEVWAQMRSRQRLTGQVNTLRRWLLDEYPGSPEAAEVAWSRGAAAEARGALDDALGHYALLAENARTHARAGQARMRSGQIHLRRSEHEAAAEVFEQYLADFPNGRRWQEAAFWAGRTRMELGDSAVAVSHLNHVLEQPVEYYAVMAAELLGVPFAVDVPDGEASAEPGWLKEGLARLDALTEAGLEMGATAEIDRLRERADGARSVTLRLAEALIERGRTIDGINLGWALLADGGAWDQRLLRVTYPFPYRELVRREAAEWGIDPFVMAAIIRQESAFKADIVSRAGAIGLMQVMPPTGAQLARAHGPRGFTEAVLTTPEVNLHLGAAFFVDMSRRYNDDWPIVLSAYNAGPTRATRWRRYPESSDPIRFTERIPFDETRGYVKSVSLNLGLYRVLYGQD